MVQRQLRTEKAFSVNLELDGFNGVKKYLASNELHSGEYVTFRIENWDVENHSDTKLFASVSLYLSDGTVISTSQTSSTLRSLVEQISADYERFSKVKLDLIRGMIGRHPIMRSWKVDNLFIESYDWVQQPQAGKAYKFGIQIPDGTYYFSGAISGDYYLATTDDAQLATDVYLEQVSGGYNLYFMNGNTKTYINIFYNCFTIVFLANIFSF